MNTFIRILPVLFFSLILLLITSCRDNFDPQTELNGSTSDILAMLREDLNTQTASIDSDNFSFISDRGAIVTAEPFSFIFKDDGSLCSGLIDFEFVEIYTKSDILRFGIPTWTLSGEILESDGEFNFAASQNGRDLILADDKSLTLRVPNPEPNTDMQLFEQIEFSWNAVDSLITDEFGYEAGILNLDWVNIDYFTKFDDELTDVIVELPTGYDRTNTLGFAVFEDLNIVLPLWGDPLNAKLPIGEKVTFVAISSEDENTFRFDSSDQTITEDLLVMLDPIRTSIEKIKAFLAALD